jgi:uncharacterized protein (TIGR02147 family)
VQETRTISPFGYLDVRKFLAALFEERKTTRRTYSYDTFSEELGFGRCSYTHQVIHGGRPITTKAAQRIAKALGCDARERRYLVALTKHLAAKNAALREAAFQEILEIRSEVLESDLDRNQLEYFSEWYHPAVRELVTFNDFDPDPHWIAKQLTPNIKPDQAARSFELLQRIGYVVLDAQTGRWMQSESHLRTPREVRSLGLVRFHQEMMERAKESLVRTPAMERDISALTLTVTEAEFHALKEMLQAFRSQVVNQFGHSNDAAAVAQLNMQLFPIAKRARG